MTIALLEGQDEQAAVLFESCDACMNRPEVRRLPEVLRSLGSGAVAATEDELITMNSPILWYRAGGEELLLKGMEKMILDGSFSRLFTYWDNPTYMDEVRTSGRFKNIVQHLGLPDYWRERGWADYCWPVGEDDFACGKYQP